MPEPKTAPQPERHTGFYHVTIPGKPHETYGFWGVTEDGKFHWRVHGIDEALDDADLLSIGERLD